MTGRYSPQGADIAVHPCRVAVENWLNQTWKQYHSREAPPWPARPLGELPVLGQNSGDSLHSFLPTPCCGHTQSHCHGAQRQGGQAAAAGWRLHSVWPTVESGLCVNAGWSEWWPPRVCSASFTALPLPQSLSYPPLWLASCGSNKFPSASGQMN